MENINMKPTTLAGVVIVIIIVIAYIIYFYIDNKMKDKLVKQKKKLKKYYEKQFNQMFYDNEVKQEEQNKLLDKPNIDFEDNREEEIIDEPDGIDSSSNSSDSSHASALDNPKILDDDYKKYGNSKMPRGNS